MSDRAADLDGRYRVEVRCLQFTPSWFWEVIDTLQGSIVENSLALSRTVYLSSAEAVAAGRRYLDGTAVRKAA